MSVQMMCVICQGEQVMSKWFLLTLSFFILSVEAQALKAKPSRYPMSPDYKKGNVLCPSDSKSAVIKKLK